MARIKISFDVEILHQVSLPVTIGHINYGGHVGNEQFLLFAQEARIDWLVKNSLSELNVGGPGLIQTQAIINYLSEVFREDQLQIQLGANEIKNHTFNFLYQMNNQKGKVVARLETAMVAYDYSLKKTAPLPEKFANLLGKRSS